MLCPIQHRCRRSMMWQVSRICYSGSPRKYRKQLVLNYASEAPQSSAATALNGLLLLASLHCPPIGHASAISVLQTHTDASIYDATIEALCDAFEQHLLGVVIANAMLAWHAMRRSGIAGMKLPLRYVVDFEGHKLDCAFEVPLIGDIDEDHHAGIAVAKMAALQVRFLHVILVRFRHPRSQETALPMLNCMRRLTTGRPTRSVRGAGVPHLVYQVLGPHAVLVQ